MARRRQTAVALGPESRDREARMRAMVDAAVTLFAAEGYGPVSTRRIADKAGCSETLLFRYFGGKRGLLTAISKGLLENSGHDPGDSFDGYEDVYSLIEGYILRVYEAMDRRAAQLKVIIAALVTEPELARDFEQLHDQEVDLLEAALRRFQDEGAIAADIDVRPVASALEQMAFAVGFLMRLVYGRKHAELAAIAATHATVLSQGLQSSTAIVPMSEALRRQTIHAAQDASEGLAKFMNLLDDWETIGSDPKTVAAKEEKRAVRARR